ncbi:MAG: redox-regulated ATPase YchF [Patescibacteria group bacterium]|nr:redox-regulated ATPase YchF [Patescibacteria group bacterium]
MSLSVGIVGLPNVGKSTLFNALLKRQQALAVNYPFATIEPNLGIVPVPDSRLEELALVVEKNSGKKPPIKPATVEFVDIAGLVKGASQGEGLGNQFLAHIRETQIICHVLRDFEDENVIREGAVSPKEDLATVRMELMLADLTTLEKQVEPKGKVEKEAKLRWQIVTDLTGGIKNSLPASQVIAQHAANLDFEDYQQVAKELSLLSAKAELIVINVSENRLSQGVDNITQLFAQELGEPPEKVLVMCNQIESDVSSLSDDDAKLYLTELGLKQSGLERLIQGAYQTLGLQSFLTAGEIEARAWTIKKGCTARQAAGVIHSDFEKKIISVKVVSFVDYIQLGGLKGAKEQGRLRTEGRDYIMQEGDVVEFMIGS